MTKLCSLAILAVLAGAALAAYPAPPPNFAANQYTTWGAKVIHGSRRAAVHVPLDNGDFVHLERLDLVGDAYTRGFAHGALMSAEIIQFTGPELDQFFRNEINHINLDKIPEPWRTLLKLLEPSIANLAPGIFAEALDWVYHQELAFFPPALSDEMRGIADGVCSQQGAGCNATALLGRVRTTNMLPELIQMSCTSFGAWGSATPNGGLVHLRALDFGGGPFANRSVLIVSRGDATNPDHAFASLSFPGFVGSVTGIAQNGVGISEKVWETYAQFPNSMQKGWYNGIPDVFALRTILERAKNRADAEQYLANANRTFGIFVGIGDFESQQMDIVEYRANGTYVFSDTTMPAQTGQPFIKNIVYVDKHPQPSGDGPTGSLPTALAFFNGQISLQNTKTIVQAHQTGDVHFAVFDYAAQMLQVGIGRTNDDGEFGPNNSTDLSQWKAYNRPTLTFSLTDLWAGL